MLQYLFSFPSERKMESLPPDMIRKVASELSPVDLIRYCDTSKQFAQACSDEYFWKQMLEKHFGQFICPETLGPDGNPPSDYHGLFLYEYGLKLLRETTDLDRHRRDINRLLSNKLRTRPIRYYYMLAPDDRVDLNDDAYIDRAHEAGEYHRLIEDLIFERFNMMPLPDFLLNWFPDMDLIEGDLIGLHSTSDAKDNEVPIATAYIYRDTNGFLMVSFSNYCGMFPVRMPKMSNEEIVQKYNLPFELGNTPEMWMRDDECWSIRKNY